MTLSAVNGRAVVELDALPQVEPPRRVVHGRPRLREARHELRVVRHLDQRVVDVAEDRGRRDGVVVRRIEREHPLGQAGDDLALSGLGGRRARPGAGRGEGGARADQDLAPGDLRTSSREEALACFMAGSSREQRVVVRVSGSIDALNFTGRRGPCQGPAPLLQSGAVTEHARAVIIGGGVGGASIAYHLTAKGWRDIVLVERAELTSGSTFHSAGLVGQLRSSVALTRLMMWSVECYRRLAAETGRDPGWKETGSLRLACTPERVLEHRRQAGWAKTFGLPLEEIGTGRGAAALPGDGARRRPRGRLPPDRRPPRPEQPRDGAGRGRAAARGDDPHGHPRPRHRRAGRPRPRGRDHRGDHPRRGRRERGRDLRAGDRADGGRDDPPRARWPTSTSSRSPSTGCTPPSRCSGTRTIWSTSGRRSAGWWPAATSASRRRGGSTASRPTSTTGSCRRTGSASPR